MSHDYKAVQWTPYKKVHDAALAIGVTAFVGAFIAAGALAFPPDEQLHPVQIVIRALGACAFALLTFILCIGPMARLSERALPLLYNRRHLGVTCFCLAFAHAGLTVLWYQSFSDVNPLVALLASNPRNDALNGFPFESLGLGALIILFVMAATSHDFWNRNLGPTLWKAIHFAVYPAYALLVAHVMLGAAQQERSLVFPAAAGLSALLVCGLHVMTGLRGARDDAGASPAADGWLEVAPVEDIAVGCARVVTPPKGEAIAVFRAKDRLFALSNVCRHQGGPLGEGRFIDDCVTCPWHGFQYREDGRSPPPYTEVVAVYQTRVVDGVAWVWPEPAMGAAAPTMLAANAP